MGTAVAMARNEIWIDSPPDVVYEALAEAENYPKWVVGAKAIRSEDADFPRPGARFKHKVGAGPVEVKDETQAIEARPGEKLVLQAKIRPIGEARVTIDLIAEGERTLVVMEEEVTSPDLVRRMRRLLDPFVVARNVVSLRRLKDLVESGQAA